MLASLGEYRLWALVGLASALFPIFLRFISSPLTLLLLFPIIICTCITISLASGILLGLLADARQELPPTARRVLPHASRPLVFTTPAAWQALLIRTKWATPLVSQDPIVPELPAASDALKEVLDLAIRDFVWAWYEDISTSATFPSAVATILRAAIVKLLDRASAIDISAFIVKRVLPKITTHIEQFRQSEIALRGAKLERSLTHSEELDLLLASRYSSNGYKLHPAVDNLSSTFTKQAEEAHLRRLLEAILPVALNQPEASSNAVKIVAREVLACSILFPVMDLLADPDFWNRAIDDVAGAAIHQQFVDPLSFFV